MQETWVQPLDWEDPLEKVMATHSGILAWRIPWAEEPGRYSPLTCKELNTTEQLTLSLFSLQDSKLSSAPRVTHRSSDPKSVSWGIRGIHGSFGPTTRNMK